MFCDRLVDFEAEDGDYYRKNFTADGNNFILSYRDKVPSMHKFFLSDEFFNFRCCPLEQWASYLDKIKPLVRLPHSPMWCEYRQNNLRHGFILEDNGDGSILVILFIERDKALSCSIFNFIPSSLRLIESKGFELQANFYKMGEDWKPKQETINVLVFQCSKIMDVIARINSPAITDIENISLDKLNIKRLKNNKKPLFSYRIVKLSTQIRQAFNYGSDSEESESRKRLHWVRGHFKVRKTGVFWWNPHTAGRGELGIAEKDYAA